MPSKYEAPSYQNKAPAQNDQSDRSVDKLSPRAALLAAASSSLPPPQGKGRVVEGPETLRQLASFSERQISKRTGVHRDTIRIIVMEKV